MCQVAEELSEIADDTQKLQSFFQWVNGSGVYNHKWTYSIWFFKYDGIGQRSKACWNVAHRYVYINSCNSSKSDY